MPRRPGKPKPLVHKIESPDGRSAVFVLGQPDGGEVRAEDASDALVEMYLALGRDVLRRRGLDAVPGAEDVLRRMAVEFRDERERETRLQGVAPHIIQLLAAPSKREAERLARSMVITGEEFTSLLHNAHPLLGYRHRMKWRVFHPEQHTAFSDEISNALRGAKPDQPHPSL